MREPGRWPIRRRGKVEESLVSEEKVGKSEDRRRGERRMSSAPQPPSEEERRKSDRRGLDGESEADA
jgi:hypothetical protein